MTLNKEPYLPFAESLLFFADHIENRTRLLLDQGKKELIEGYQGRSTPHSRKNPAAKRAAMGNGHWPRGHSQAQATSTGEVTGQYNASNNYGQLNWCHQFSAEMRMKTNLEVQKRTSWCNSISYNL